MDKPLIIFSGILIPILFLFGILSLGNESLLPFVPTETQYRSISVDGSVLRVEVVDTPATLERGLSGRESLGPGRGMLFVFDRDEEWRIWMKDMRFAIDIFWINADGVIVGITPYATPQSYPEIFSAGVPSRYVLETVGGFSEIYNIKIGDTVDL